MSRTDVSRFLARVAAEPLLRSRSLLPYRFGECRPAEILSSTRRKSETGTQSTVNGMNDSDKLALMRRVRWGFEGSVFFDGGGERLQYVRIY